MNTKHILIVQVLAAVLIISPVLAEELLLWEDCIQEAVKKHPELISAREKVEQTRASRSITKSGLLPQIGLTATGQRGQSVARTLVPGDPPGTFSSENDTILDNTFSYKLTGKQLLFDGFKTYSSLASASKTLSASEYDYEVVSSNIRLHLREAFIELFRAQELLSLTEDIAERKRKNLKLVQLRYKGGREHRGALLTAEADVLQAEFEISQAQRNIELTQVKLIKELGRDKYSPVSVKAVFETSMDISIRPSFELLTEETPILKKLIALKEAARLGLRSAKADYFPKVYLDASIGRTDSEFPPGYTEWIAGVNLTFPLFDGSKRKGEVRKAESMLNQAKADERSEHDKVICILAEAWINLQNAVEEKTVKDKFLQAAKERANIANSQYSTGLISFNDWIIIEDNLVMAQKLFLNANANVLVKEAYWFQAKGGTLEHE